MKIISERQSTVRLINHKQFSVLLSFSSSQRQCEAFVRHQIWVSTMSVIMWAQKYSNFCEFMCLCLHPAPPPLAGKQPLWFYITDCWQTDFTNFVLFRLHTARCWFLGLWKCWSCLLTTIEDCIKRCSSQCLLLKTAWWYPHRLRKHKSFAGL